MWEHHYPGENLMSSNGEFWMGQICGPGIFISTKINEGMWSCHKNTWATTWKQTLLSFKMHDPHLAYWRLLAGITNRVDHVMDGGTSGSTVSDVYDFEQQLSSLHAGFFYRKNITSALFPLHLPPHHCLFCSLTCKQGDISPLRSTVLLYIS